jgi:hypothetical protein
LFLYTDDHRSEKQIIADSSVIIELFNLC